MGLLSGKSRFVTFFLFLAFFIGLLVYNILQGSQWFLDNTVAILFLSTMFFSYRWLRLSPGSFFALSFVLLLHNLGTFGFYARTFDGYAYDNIIHFSGAVVAAWIVFNFVSSKMHIRKNRTVAHTVLDEHKVVFIFLVMASVAMLGTLVELVEYAGFVYLGPGEGLFFTGSGDGGYSTTDYELQYKDTMDDIIVNTFGSAIGVFAFYMMRYRKQCWMGRCNME